MTGSVGYYNIVGWLKAKDASGFDAKPAKVIHTGTSRERIRTMFKGYCYEAEDPRLLKVMYYYANNKPRDVTKDLRPREFAKLVRNRRKD